MVAAARTLFHLLRCYLVSCTVCICRLQTACRWRHQLLCASFAEEFTSGLLHTTPALKPSSLSSRLALPPLESILSSSAASSQRPPSPMSMERWQGAITTSRTGPFHCQLDLLQVIHRDSVRLLEGGSTVRLFILGLTLSPLAIPLVLCSLHHRIESLPIHPCLPPLFSSPCAVHVHSPSPLQVSALCRLDSLVAAMIRICVHNKSRREVVGPLLLFLRDLLCVMFSAVLGFVRLRLLLCSPNVALLRSFPLALVFLCHLPNARCTPLPFPHSLPLSRGLSPFPLVCPACFFVRHSVCIRCVSLLRLSLVAQQEQQVSKMHNRDCYESCESCFYGS
jgi:hypothetical protein